MRWGPIPDEPVRLQRSTYPSGKGHTCTVRWLVKQINYILYECSLCWEDARDHLGNAESAGRVSQTGVSMCTAGPVLPRESAGVISRGKTSKAVPDDPDDPKQCQPRGARTFRPFEAS